MNFFKVITAAVLIIQLLSSQVIAQKTSKYADIRNVDIKLSELQKDNDHAEKVLGYSNNTAYLDLSYYGNRIRIYDEIKNEFTKIIELKQEGGLYKSSGTEFLTSYSIDGKLYLIHENYSKSDNILNFFATIIDKDGSILTKEKVFFSIECQKRSDVKLNIKKETDFLLIGAVINKEKENNIAYIMAKYTLEFEKIDITTVDNEVLNINGEGRFLEPIHGFTDELFLTAVYQTIPKKKKGKSISTIYVVNKEGKLSFSQQLNVDRFNLFEFKIFKIGKSTIIRAYYSDDNSSGIDGIVQFAYDSKLKKFIVKDTYKISSNVKSKFMNAGMVEEDRGISPFKYQDILVTKDKKMYVLNVREITTGSTTSSANGGGTTTYSYSTGEYQMLEVYDSTGKITSVTSVKTDDLSINYGDKSMHLISNGESVAIVYLLNHQVSMEVKGEKKLRKMYAPQFISNLDNLNQQKDIYIETSGDKKFRSSRSFLLGNTGKILIVNYRTITIGGAWVDILNLPVKYRIGVAQMPLK